MRVATPETVGGDWSCVQLGTWPTPLDPAPRLAQSLGLGPEDLWVKRDDLVGLGGGGNKVRKLEWLAGTALARGATTLVTSGALQSNHARLTAAAGARLGLDVVLVLTGDPAPEESGNLALDGLLGARVVRAVGLDHAEAEALVEDVADQLRQTGAIPAVIPFGGSSVLGAQGYVEAGSELLAQAPDLDVVVVAVGSGGTMAGLVHALGPERVLGVDCGAVPQPAATVTELIQGLSHAADEPELRLRLDQVGEGYGYLTQQVEDAIVLTARCEGIVLDPIYTGRAMAGLIAAVQSGEIQPGRRIVFLHTGGLPGLFGHPAAVARARELLAENAWPTPH
jgi:L-cysteate sulfo-lyase